MTSAGSVRRARRIAAAAAYGGGGLGLASLAAVGLLAAEAKLARWRVGHPDETAPCSDGVYDSGSFSDTGDGSETDGREAGHGTHDVSFLSMAMLGDSIAAGVGLTDPRDTPAALIASGLSAVSEKPVRLTSVAQAGARSSDLDEQITQVLPARLDIAVIMVGGNDVMRRVPPARAVADLGKAVRRLLDENCAVLVGTCPDLGTVQPIIQPLRRLVGQASRQLAAAQTVEVVEAGGRTVSLGDMLGPAFVAEPLEMFGPDQFHPSVRGYASAAAGMLPAACDALGLWTEAEQLPESQTSVLPVYLAAAEAAEKSGTEVAGTQVRGRDRGPRGRWARVLPGREGTAADDGNVPRVLR